MAVLSIFSDEIIDGDGAVSGAIEDIMASVTALCSSPVEEHLFGRLQCIVALRNSIHLHMARLSAAKSATIIEIKLPTPALLPNIIKGSPNDMAPPPPSSSNRKRKISARTRVRRSKAQEMKQDAQLAEAIMLSKRESEKERMASRNEKFNQLVASGVKWHVAWDQSLAMACSSSDKRTRPNTRH